MEMRGMMGGFYKLSEWIMRLAVTNLLWIVTSLPFWYFILIGFRGLQMVETEQELTSLLYTSVILLAVLAPFTIFPATAAIFSVARKWVLGDVDVPLFKTFFRSYKQNFLQAMIGGILYALLFAILIIDFRVYFFQFENNGFQIVAYIFIALIVLLAVSMLYFFALLSHFHMKMFQLLKNAVILTIGRPVRSIMIVLGTLFVVYISAQFTFLIPFFMGSIIAIYTFFHFNLIIQKMMAAKEQKDAELLAEVAPEVSEDADKLEEDASSRK